MNPHPLALRRGESPADWLGRSATGLVQPVLHRAQQPAAALTETVHLIRVTTKRLRALLQLIRPALRKATFTQEYARLRAASARLAAARDCQVARQTLQALLQSSRARPHRAALRLLPLFQATAAPPAHPAAQAIAASTQDLEKSRQFFLSVHLPENGWSSIAAGLQASYRRARRRWKKARSRQDDPSLHRWRTAAKQLAYQLTWLTPVRPKRFSKLAARLRQLEKDLGAAHDLISLRSSLFSPSAPKPRSPAHTWLRRAIRQRYRRLQSCCLASGSALFAHHPRHFAPKNRALRPGKPTSPNSSPAPKTARAPSQRTSDM